jgi:hypothetical protein
MMEVTLGTWRNNKDMIIISLGKSIVKKDHSKFELENHKIYVSRDPNFWTSINYLDEMILKEREEKMELKTQKSTNQTNCNNASTKVERSNNDVLDSEKV